MAPPVASIQPSSTNLGFMVSRTVREYIQIVLNHQFCDNLLQKTQKTNTALIYERQNITYL